MGEIDEQEIPQNVNISNFDRKYLKSIGQLRTLDKKLKKISDVSLRNSIVDMHELHIPLMNINALNTTLLLSGTDPFARMVSLLTHLVINNVSLLLSPPSYPL